MAEDKNLKKLEKDIVENQDKMTEAQFEDEERKVIEDKRQSNEGDIEEEENAGQEPYPEIEKALKDPEEEEDDDKLD